MYYEWDASKARRAYIFKILATWMAAIAAASLPVLMAVNAMTFL